LSDDRAGTPWEAHVGHDVGHDVGPEEQAESYNPWSIVNLVFTHLAEQGLHPVLGESGDPGPPAHDLLVALGIEPANEGNRAVDRDVKDHLAELREAYEQAENPSQPET
jgi:hypothetical protein